MNIRFALFALFVPLLLSACGRSDPMSAFQSGETGRVVRVMDGDSIVLDTGQSVRLVGIEAPAFGRDGAEDAPHAEASRRMLEDRVLGRRVRLYYAGLTRDRYDRALAHVKTEDRLGPVIWVNRDLVRVGAARVRTYPDTAQGAEALFEVETIAMAEGRGLWDEVAYRPLDARDLGARGAGFVIFEGVLGPREPAEFEETACMRALLGSQVTVTVERAAMAACDLETGLRVQVRGWYRDGRLRLNAAANLRPRAAVPLAQVED
ncbi:MAG: thermonuclease family protein [Hyphomonadaceae bacterium]|nr:thermonuclease family protein [Hyphomonadaceae bacterium]